MVKDLLALISLHFYFFFASLPNPEKLIEGLKSPDTSLLLPDLLPMTDPFGSTAEAVIGNVIVSVSLAVRGVCVCARAHVRAHASGVRSSWLTGKALGKSREQSPLVFQPCLR